MQPDNGNRASPAWRSLYEAAVLEVDLDKLPQRIADAESAIMNCMEGLNHCDGSESEALMDALNMLRDLRKMPKDGSGR